MQPFGFGSLGLPPPSRSESNYGVSPPGWAPPPSPFANEPKQMISDQHELFSHPQAAGPDTSEICQPYYQSQFQDNPFFNRKKPVRAQQACDNCRTRKAKCDEARPCGHCKDNQLTCTYREIPPHKQDRNVLALEAKLDNLQREMGHMQREMNDKLDRLLRFYESLSEEPIQITTLQNAALWSSVQTNFQQGAVPIVSVDPADPDNDTTNTLPHSHTTAAENLPTRPMIQAFPPGSIPNYVMMEEDHRGILRHCGTGGHYHLPYPPC
jgi:Fungal Zn(2)-Cys(6) binuclear cluster domain